MNRQVHRLRHYQLNRSTLYLALILIAGAALRFYGLFHPQKYFFHADEKRLIEWGRDFNFLDPIASEWGTLPFLGVKAMEAGLILLQIPVNHINMTMAARVVAALTGVLTIFLTYQLAKRAYGQSIGLLAAAFTALTVLLIQDAHFYTLDGIFLLVLLLAFFPILSVSRRGRMPSYLAAGIMIGLALATRLNGIFLLVPLLISHLFFYFGHNRSSTNLLKVLFQPKLWLSMLLAGATFLLLTPALLLDTKDFLFHDGLVWVLLQSGGTIKERYTLQFEGTTPVYYFSNLLFWASGPFLLLAYLGGVIYNLRHWKRSENLILLGFVLPHLWLGAGTYVKFIRYTLPLLPLLNILAAAFFLWVWRAASQKAFLKQAIVLWLGLTLVGTSLYALAFTRIYSQPDTRLLAGRWIEAYVPPSSKIARDSNDVQSGLVDFEGADTPEFQLIKIDFDRLYRSSQPAMDSQFPAYFAENNIFVSRRGSDGNDPDDDFTPMSDEEKWQHIRDQIRCADYIVFTERNYALYQDRADLFPVEHRYYAELFNGDLGYQLVKQFDRKPGLFNWHIDDSQAELTFHLFDHSPVWIFQAQPPLDFFYSQRPESQPVAHLADTISLLDYELKTQAAKAGEQLSLRLYWQALQPMTEDYTIFVHLQNEDGQVAAQNDHQIADGLLPTSCWRPGRALMDQSKLTIAADAAPGPYQLKVGVYSGATLERLAVSNDQRGENAIYLIDLEILP